MLRSHRSARGVTLFELLTTLAVLSLTAGLTSAAVHAFAGMTSLRAASHEIASVFSQARSRALFRNAYSGVKWIARDGDLTARDPRRRGRRRRAERRHRQRRRPARLRPRLGEEPLAEGDRRLHSRVPRAGPEGEPGRRPLRPDPLRPLRHRELLARRRLLARLGLARRRTRAGRRSSASRRGARRSGSTSGSPRAAPGSAPGEAL